MHASWRVARFFHGKVTRPQPRDWGRYLALLARRTPLKSNVSSWTFSLKTLLIIVTLATLFLGLHLVIGPASWAIDSFVLLVIAGFTSHMANTPVPYWKCVGSAAILFYLLPPLDYQPYPRANDLRFDCICNWSFPCLFIHSAWPLVNSIAGDGCHYSLHPFLGPSVTKCYKQLAWYRKLLVNLALNAR